MMAESRNIILIALLLGICLAIANHYAEPRVKAERETYAMAQLQEVIQSASVQLNYQADTTTHPLVDGMNRTGRLEQLIAADGYNGDITFWLATIDETTGSKVIGVRVIHHQETPGLGDKLELAVSDWVFDFNGKSLRNSKWDVEKYGGDFDQFSGATITPRAVVRRIASRLQELDQQTNPSEVDANG